ncbi:hypothetical protein [Spirosoma aerophilum]
MTIELYSSPQVAEEAEVPEAPVSNLNGELPDAEPALDLGDLLGTFDSREEAIEFLTNQAKEQRQVVIDSQSAPFSDYTHIEWLSLILSKDGQENQKKSYYLVTDEGY